MSYIMKLYMHCVEQSMIGTSKIIFLARCSIVIFPKSCVITQTAVRVMRAIWILILQKCRKICQRILHSKASELLIRLGVIGKTEINKVYEIIRLILIQRNLRKIAQNRFFERDSYRCVATASSLTFILNNRVAFGWCIQFMNIQ